MKGRPLRFLGATLGGWAAIRLAMLLPEAAPLPALIRAIAPPAVAAVPALVADRPPPPATVRVAIAPVPAPSVPAAAVAPKVKPYRPGDPRRIALALAAMVRYGPAEVVEDPTLPPPLPPTPPARPPSRIAGSVWAIARGDGGDRSVPGAQLGGSQAGARLTYALDGARRVALAGRVSTPLSGLGREAALGVEWRPLDAPVRLIAEQRWSLDGGRGGPTAMVVAGLNPTRVGPLTAEAYAQGGAIARGRVDGFADGAARLSAPLARGRLRLDLGIGAWGGVQPGAARVDVGPSLGVGVPVAGKRLRVTLDWRQRVAGTARPGSGPALSIGSDF